MLTFLRDDVLKIWSIWLDEATDNFRVIDLRGFRILE